MIQDRTYSNKISYTTKAIIIIYLHGDDPVVLNIANDSINMDGRKKTDTNPCVIGVSTRKHIGEASGKFNIRLKASKIATELFLSLTDDDWLDIIYQINDKYYHLMRGSIDGISRSKTVGASGATVSSYTIVGRDHGKIWESTPVWFSPYGNDLLTEITASRVFNGIPEVFGSPSEAVVGFLKGFLENIEGSTGINWQPPKRMPGVIGANILSNIEFSTKYFQNIPMRTIFNPNSLLMEGTLWDLAKKYSDSVFTELYTDYLPVNDPFNLDIGNPLDLGKGKMVVVFRDKPFPNLVESMPIGYKNLWDSLPIFNLDTKEIIAHEVSRTGYERYNGFFITPRLLQEEINSYSLTLMAPLMDKDSIKRHSFRRFDAQIETHPDTNNPLSMGGLNIDKMCEYQRNLLRDWYCLNPYYLSGVIDLGHGRPDIKIGCRLKIPGIVYNLTQVRYEENYYIEGIMHEWAYGKGLRTHLEVTRGWMGSMSYYYTVLNRISKKYSVSELSDIFGDE